VQTRDGIDLKPFILWLAALSAQILTQVGPTTETLLVAGVLIVIGIIVIMVIGALLFFLPAVVIAGVVWYLTASELYAGLAFLAVALLSLTRRK
jgi:hypothetical protein